MGEGVDLDSIGDSGAVIALASALERFAGRGCAHAASARAIAAIADTAIRLETLIASGALRRLSSEETTEDDRDQPLDMIAHRMFCDALAQVPVAAIGSRMADRPTIIDPDAAIAVAIDPLHGAPCLDTNVPLGTMFSILPVTDDVDTALLQPGHRQLAAGFVMYGPQTCLVLTLGAGTDIYTLDREERVFLRMKASVRIAADSTDYAINASNYRHWDPPIQRYIDDKVAGIDAPSGRNFNMRWSGSPVAEAYRILIRGGIFLYPGDRREGYEKGRLRLVYAANPLAMIIEQAGGLATEGEERILDIQPGDLRQRVPLIFGSKDKVLRVRAYHDGTLPLGERSPLFGRRGLFRS